MYMCTLYFLSSPPEIINPLHLFQSKVSMIPSCAFHWLGFKEGCNGLITNDLPVVYNTCLLSGDQVASYTGIATHKIMRVWSCTVYTI